jgi:outer membrane protein TolC
MGLVSTRLASLRVVGVVAALVACGTTTSQTFAQVQLPRPVLPEQTSAPRASTALTARDAVAHALARSAEMGGVLADVDRALALREQATAAWWPRISAVARTGVDASAQGSRSGNSLRSRVEAGPQLSWTLVDWGARSARDSAALAGVDGARAAVRGELNRQTLTTLAAIFELSRQFELGRASQFAHQQTLAYATALRLSPRGDVPRDVLARVEARLSAKAIEVSGRRIDIARAEAEVERLLGFVPGSIVLPAPPVLSVSSFAEALARARAVNPTLEAARQQQRRAERERDALEADRYGTIGLEASGVLGRNAGGRGSRTDGSALVVWTLPLDFAGSGAARTNAASASVTQATFALLAAERGAQSSLQEKWASLTEAGQRVEAADAHLQAELVALDAYDDAVRLGRRTVDQLLDTVDSLAGAYGQVRTLRLAALLGRFSVAAEVGELASTLELEPLFDALERASSGDIRRIQQDHAPLR